MPDSRRLRTKPSSSRAWTLGQGDKPLAKRFFHVNYPQEKTRSGIEISTVYFHCIFMFIYFPHIPKSFFDVPEISIPVRVSFSSSCQAAMILHQSRHAQAADFMWPYPQCDGVILLQPFETSCETASPNLKAGHDRLRPPRVSVKMLQKDVEHPGKF